MNGIRKKDKKMNWIKEEKILTVAFDAETYIFPYVGILKREERILLNEEINVYERGDIWANMSN